MKYIKIIDANRADTIPYTNKNKVLLFKLNIQNTIPPIKDKIIYTLKIIVTLVTLK